MSQNPVLEPSGLTDDSVGAAIDRFVHRIRDIKLAARIAIPALSRARREGLSDLSRRLRALKGLAQAPGRFDTAPVFREISDIDRRVDRFQNSMPSAVVESGLFLSLFSTFDAFVGDLVVSLYRLRPESCLSLDKTITLNDVIAAKSIDSLKRALLAEDIEQLRRRSYSEQFESLGRRFNITLTAFPHWPAFIEASQRRNLLTHCDGVVSEQYRSACIAAGVSEQSLPKTGERLELGAKYVYGSCELLIEVGLKLGQTLWRKLAPSEIATADAHLKQCLFNALSLEIWPRARMIGEYAMSLRNIASDVDRRILRINYAQALLFGGATAEAEKTLSELDWTASALDFRLAVAVLERDFERAGALVQQIGKMGEFANEHAYHTWPLFRDFRDSPQFLDSYARVFDHPFQSIEPGNIEELERLAKSLESESVESMPNTSTEPAMPDPAVESQSSGATPHPSSSLEDDMRSGDGAPSERVASTDALPEMPVQE